MWCMYVDNGSGLLISFITKIALRVVTELRVTELRYSTHPGRDILKNFIAIL